METLRNSSFGPAYWSQVTGIMSACLEDVIHDRQVTACTLPPGVLREAREFLRLAACEIASPTPKLKASTRQLREIESYRRFLGRLQPGYALHGRDQKIASRLQKFLRIQQHQCEGSAPVFRRECDCQYGYAWWAERSHLLQRHSAKEISNASSPFRRSAPLPMRLSLWSRSYRP